MIAVIGSFSSNNANFYVVKSSSLPFLSFNGNSILTECVDIFNVPNGLVLQAPDKSRSKTGEITWKTAKTDSGNVSKFVLG